MFKKDEKYSQVVHKVVHIKNRIVIINNMSKKYTIPKLYIPKDKRGNATVKPRKYWYIYYYFENPLSKNRTRKLIQHKFGINKLKTVKERKQLGKEMVIALTNILKEGYNPFENQEFKINADSFGYTVVEALNYAYNEKINEWKQSTIDDIRSRKNGFIEWLKMLEIHGTLVQEINKRHITSFLNFIAKKNSSRTVNNYKSGLSALFTKLVDDGILSSNIILTIKKRKTKPKRHKPYTQKQLREIKAFLLENDMYLYYFMCFVAYAFLRNSEVCRLRVKDIDFDNWLIAAKGTKTSTLDVLRIIKTLQPIITKMKLHKYKKSDFLFTTNQCSGDWDIKTRDKVSRYGKRFKEVKKTINLDPEHTIYSMRHTFAVDLFNSFLKQNLTEREAILKMLPITRHSNESGLRNYLRDVNAFLPKDYSSEITIDF